MTERVVALKALATYVIIPENSAGGARCDVKAPGGELQSHSEGGIDRPMACVVFCDIIVGCLEDSANQKHRSGVG